ncbi:MAG: PSD1 and planctomycete cytochrome C domain-containing protein, partial [Planctomycetota bacterium]|nr:PSD1 and planctomycete cytochrome C domain-containing protein [Planctomycetota bacterium]
MFSSRFWLRRECLMLVVVLHTTVGWVNADDAKPLPAAADRAVDFNTDIRPIFAKFCDSCHGADKQLSGFRLDREGDALRGGDSGKAFEPGKSAESLLVKYIAGLDPDILMPPEGEQLSKEQIALVRGWIDQGAKWGAETKSVSGQASKHWSFQPVKRPAPPVVKKEALVRNLVDRFVQARLESEKIEPSPEADRSTLIRRLSLDLLGLPPTPEQVAAFLADTRPNAYELLVEELLASPHFGERWGRHWLDLARYADSDGYEKDSPRPYAWRYRQWVIEALNRDLPFNQFTIEQLAGDLFPEARPDQKIATGFHRNTLTNKEGGVDPEEFRVAAVVDRVNTTATVWLGLTLGCAQCHSHKYDPLTLREYYGFFAFFNQGNELDLAAALPGDDKAVAPTISEVTPRRPTHVMLRGDFLRPGDEVPPHTPEVLPPLGIAADQVATRMDLARWLAHPQNPLTPRVTVNRVWRQLFGQAIVPSVEDFGTRGDLPSHPELLDWLAAEFTLPTLEMVPPPRPNTPPTFRGPWSLKRMIKIITCSAAYRRESKPRADLVDRDPKNTLLARQNRFRVEAELVRDQALAASGLLHPAIGGPSVRPKQPAGVSELTYAGSARWVESAGPDKYRRGMYTWFQRTSPYPMLMTFDAPESNIVCTRRERSNTPLQSLTLLNDPVFVECAQALGTRVYREQPAELVPRIDRLFSLCLARSPSTEERQTSQDLFQQLRSTLASSPAELMKLIEGSPGAENAPVKQPGATQNSTASSEPPLTDDQRLD